MKKYIFLLCILLVSCNPYEAKFITTYNEKWYGENTNTSDCSNISGKIYCPIINPCIIIENKENVITEKIIEKCCPNGQCHFESPKYDGRLVFTKKSKV